MLNDSCLRSENSVSRIVRTVSHHGLDDYNRYSSLMQIEKSPRIIPAKFGFTALRVAPASPDVVDLSRFGISSEARNLYESVPHKKFSLRSR
jgi:hypothetical protein